MTASDQNEPCPYCLDVLKAGPDEFCCEMQEDDYWRRRRLDIDEQKARP